MEDLEVGPVIEDAATGTSEDAPVPAWRISLEMLAKERDQFRMEGRRAGFAARTVLELAALASRAAVGPPGAAARLGVGQDQFAPAVVGQAGEVLGAQFDSFFGAQRRVVHAAEKGDHPLPTFTLLTDCGEQPPGLGAVDHCSRVTVLRVRGRVHLTALSGLAGRTPVS